jgi:hypothetical protein
MTKDKKAIGVWHAAPVSRDSINAALLLLLSSAAPEVVEVIRALEKVRTNSHCLTLRREDWP